MPDLWDELPIEMLGERPSVVDVSNKQMVKPTEVARIEKGRGEIELGSQVFGSPETK